MKFLIIGIGSIGSRHARNLLALGIPPKNVVLYDNNSDRLKKVGKKLSIKNLYENLEDIKSNYSDAFFDGILITLPTSLHLSTYNDVKALGKYFFIEKPISHTMENVETLLQNKNRIMIAYNWRFERGIIIVKKLLDENIIGNINSSVIEYGSYLPDWHPDSDYSKEYSAKRELGGGIILDDTHEIDLALHFFGDPDHVSGHCAKVSNLNIETEDVAEIFIRFKGNILCNIHMDYLQRSPTRKGKVIGEKGVIEWDANRSEVRIFETNKNNWEIIKYVSETNDMYLEEMKYFLQHVKEEKDIELNAEVGVASLKIAVQILKDNKMI